MSNKPKPFAIIEFDELINNKKSVELVPVSWLTENETMCFWPPKDKEHKVPELVEFECAPESTWRTYQVEILGKDRIVDFDGLAVYLEKFLAAEFDKMKRSLLLTIASKYDTILKAVEYKADPPQKTQAWKEIGEKLPFENLDNFLEFDESLKTDEKKQNALVDIFQMAAAGCASYEADVPAIMAKLIKKDVQVQYSGCGKKSKGVGKLSFKETETFKIMDKFLTAKYYDSKNNKLKIVSEVSRYLSGANDRDGGRAKRDKEI